MAVVSTDGSAAEVVIAVYRRPTCGCRSKSCRVGRLEEAQVWRKGRTAREDADGMQPVLLKPLNMRVVSPVPRDECQVQPVRLPSRRVETYVANTAPGKSRAFLRALLSSRSCSQDKRRRTVEPEEILSLSLSLSTSASLTTLVKQHFRF